MSPDFSGLRDLATNPTGGWAPPTLADVVGEPMTVLAFDQSLNSTGSVVLVRTRERVWVAESVTLRGGTTGAEGFIHDYRRAIAIEMRVAGKVAHWASDDYPLLVVHETPPVATRRLPGGGASSKAAGQAIWHACAPYGIEPEILNSQQAKKFVCGNSKAEKAEAHAALKQHVFPWVLGSSSITNEHERDAALLGLLAMSRSNRG